MYERERIRGKLRAIVSVKMCYRNRHLLTYLLLCIAKWYNNSYTYFQSDEDEAKQQQQQL